MSLHVDKPVIHRVAQAVKAELPPHTGFIVFVFPFDRDRILGDSEPRLSYVSNGERKDCINLIKEWMLKCGAAEDWMKHI